MLCVLALTGGLRTLSTHQACRWACGLGAHARLFTSSYDGSIRRLDPSTGVFDPILLRQDLLLHSCERMPCPRTWHLHTQHQHRALLSPEPGIALDVAEAMQLGLWQSMSCSCDASACASLSWCRPCICITVT